MSWIQKGIAMLIVWACAMGGALAESSNYAVGDTMPMPVKEHFAVSFWITCSEADAARVDRYEHADETTLLTYRNHSKVPYGYYLVHTSTLLLDNDPQDGHIDSVSVLNLEDDIKICGVLPQ